MSSDPKCPKCESQHTYYDGNLWICPECGHEWNQEAKQEAEQQQTETGIVRDAFGNELQEGDTISVIKELKVKGASSAIKVGTKAKNIRLGDYGDDHDISCKIPGFGSINLKSKFVKKS